MTADLLNSNNKDNLNEIEILKDKILELEGEVDYYKNKRMEKLNKLLN